VLKLPFDPKEIKPGEFTYFTKRPLENNEGEEKGEVIIWRRKEEKEHSYILLCPFCAKEQEGKVVFAKRPYRLKCSSCGKSMTIKRLQDI